MRFRLVHKLATFLLSGIAVATLLSSSILSMPIVILVASAMVIAWFADPDARMGQAFARVGGILNIATLLILAVTVFEVARSFPDLDLSPFLNFVLFLLVLKLCQRRTGRDHLQIFVLSFLIMLAAAWTATGVVFVIGFAAYGLMATWCLVLFHLRREIEENYIVRHASESHAEHVTATRVLNSRRVVGGAFFATTGAIAILVILGSSFVFAMVPRVGLGFILGGVRRQVGIAGFTDQVRLGMHGSISTDNQTVVLRAQVPSIAAIRNEHTRDQVIASVYWRGTVYDTYQGSEWLRSRDESLRTRLSGLYSGENLGRDFVIIDPFSSLPTPRSKNVKQESVAQTIEVVALAHPVAFAIDRPVLFEIPQPQAGSFTAIDIEPRWSGEISLRAFRVNPANPFDRNQPLGEFMGATYRAFSRTTDIPTVSMPTSELPPEALARYLHVPESLTPRVRALAESIAGRATGPNEKIRAVVDWLRRTHGYTTNLRRDERIADPIEDFLLAEKAGHCEYFASSAAILLRLAGVPTRYVNGFLGGEWNELRKVITVRENRAHSWIEAYVSGEGWVRVDATPAVGRSSRMGTLSQLLDSAELFWSRWVIEYSASQQLLLAQRLGHRLGFSGHDYFSGGKRHGPLGRRQAWLVTGVLLAIVVIITQRKRLLRLRGTRHQGSTRRKHGEAPIVRVYRVTLDRLASAGLPRMASETPHEYAKRMERSRLQGAELLAQLTDVYAAARYGEAEVAPEVVARLREQAAQIRLST
jgi:hypothetical protein